MKKLMLLALSCAALFGCEPTPQTNDQSNEIYARRLYTPVGPNLYTSDFSVAGMHYKTMATWDGVTVFNVTLDSLRAQYYAGHQRQDTTGGLSSMGIERAQGLVGNGDGQR